MILSVVGVSHAQVPEVTVIVTVEREALSANDSTALRVWIANRSAVPVDSAVLNASGPWFVEFRDSSGIWTPGRLTRILGAIPGYGLENYTLYARTTNSIEEGDVRLALALEYQWNPEGRALRGHARTLSEAKLRVGLLGNESVAGVSLRLAALIVPGLLFLLILRLADSKFASALNSTEAVTVSVLFSVLLGAVAAAVCPPPSRNAISTPRFLILCGIATGLSLVCLVVAATLAHYGKRYRVLTTDGPKEALEKLLKQRRGSLIGRFSRTEQESGAAVSVILNGESTPVVGSLIGETDGGGSVLLGWFQVSVARSDQLFPAFERVSNDPLALLSLAERHKLELKVNQGITGTGNEEIRRYDPGKVVGVTDAKGGISPLVFKEE